MRANGPLKRVLLIILLVTFGEAFRNALSLFFMRDVVGIETIGTAYLVYFATGLAAIPLWLALGRRLGKGERDVLGYRLAQALANVQQAADYAKSGQPDRVVAVLSRAARAGSDGWRVLLDADDDTPDAASGEAASEGASRPGEVG